VETATRASVHSEGCQAELLLCTWKRAGLLFTERGTELSLVLHLEGSLVVQETSGNSYQNLRKNREELSLRKFSPFGCLFLALSIRSPLLAFIIPTLGLLFCWDEVCHAEHWIKHISWT
jgi:hypothetical protein